jgi:hypothetical protein
MTKVVKNTKFSIFVSAAGFPKDDHTKSLFLGFLSGGMWVFNASTVSHIFLLLLPSGEWKTFDLSARDNVH